MKNLIKSRDVTKFEVARPLHYKVTYNFLHSQTYNILGRDYNIDYAGEILRNEIKYKSRERKFGIGISPKNSPFTLRLEQSFRKNIFNNHSCLEYLQNDFLPSTQVSISLEFAKLLKNYFIRSSLKYAINSNMNNFLKFHFNLIKSTYFYDRRIKVVSDTQIGKLINLNSAHIPLNDRFMLFNEYGFRNLGHTEKPSRAYENLSKDEDVIGEDLGVGNLLTQTIRIHLCNIPWLKKYGVSPFLYGRSIWYPHWLSEWKGGQKLLKYNRLSFGGGLSLAVNDLIGIQIYYNLLSFGSRSGDINKIGFGITIALL